MTIDALTGAVGEATTKLDSSKSLSKFAEDFDDFLKLLVTQLQNQDPTEPLDTNEFTAQIVSFTGVEQAINSNKRLENIIDLTKDLHFSNLASFSGKDVEVKGNFVTFDGTNDTRFSYELEEDVKNAFVTIKDVKGVTVFNGIGTTKAGRNNITWDGIDNSGNPLNPSIYQIIVTAEKDGGVIENIETNVRGKVLGVIMDQEEPKLIVNGEEVALDDVNFIGEQI